MAQYLISPNFKAHFAPSTVDCFYSTKGNKKRPNVGMRSLLGKDPSFKHLNVAEEFETKKAQLTKRSSLAEYKEDIKCLVEETSKPMTTAYLREIVKEKTPVLLQKRISQNKEIEQQSQSQNNASGLEVSEATFSESEMFHNAIDETNKTHDVNTPAEQIETHNVNTAIEKEEIKRLEKSIMTQVYFQRGRNLEKPYVEKLIEEGKITTKQKHLYKDYDFYDISGIADAVDEEAKKIIEIKNITKDVPVKIDTKHKIQCQLYMEMAKFASCDIHYVNPQGDATIQTIAYDQTFIDDIHKQLTELVQEIRTFNINDIKKFYE